MRIRRYSETSESDDGNHLNSTGASSVRLSILFCETTWTGNAQIGQQSHAIWLRLVEHFNLPIPSFLVQSGFKFPGCLWRCMKCETIAAWDMLAAMSTRITWMLYAFLQCRNG